MEIKSICSQIKLELKAKGITQDDFSIMLGVSTPTIKRWLKGDGLLFKDLTRMLDCLELKLSEVSLKVEGKFSNNFTYSPAQEDILSSNEGLLAFFDLLLKGKSPTQIAKSYALSEKSLNFYLLKLDKIKLIEWLPKNKVKLLVTGEPVWIPGGALSNKFRKQIVDEHFRHNLADRDHLRVGVYSLSKTSFQKISSLYAEVIEKIRYMEIKDSNVSESKKLSTITLGFSQNEIPLFDNIPNK